MTVWLFRDLQNDPKLLYKGWKDTPEENQVKSIET